MSQPNPAVAFLEGVFIFLYKHRVVLGILLTLLFISTLFCDAFNDACVNIVPRRHTTAMHAAVDEWLEKNKANNAVELPGWFIGRNLELEASKLSPAIDRTKGIVTRLSSDPCKAALHDLDEILDDSQADREVASTFRGLSSRLETCGFEGRGRKGLAGSLSVLVDDTNQLLNYVTKSTGPVGRITSFRDSLRGLDFELMSVRSEGRPPYLTAVTLAAQALGPSFGIAALGLLALLALLYSGMLERMTKLAVGTTGLTVDLAVLDEHTELRSARAQDSAHKIKSQLDETLAAYRLKATQLLEDATKGDLDGALDQFVDQVLVAIRFAHQYHQRIQTGQNSDVDSSYKAFNVQNAPDTGVVREELRVSVLLPDLLLRDYLVQARPYKPGGGRNKAGRAFGTSAGIIGRAWRRRSIQIIPALARLKNEPDGEGLLRDYYHQLPEDGELKKARQSLCAVPLTRSAEEKPQGVLFIDYPKSDAFFPKDSEQGETAFKHAIDVSWRLSLWQHVESANDLLQPFRLDLRPRDGKS